MEDISKFLAFLLHEGAKEENNQGDRLAELYNRIILRLNPTTGKDDKLIELITNVYNERSEKDPSIDKIKKLKEEITIEFQKMLKKEWERVKQGEKVFRITKWIPLALIVISIIVILVGFNLGSKQEEAHIQEKNMELLTGFFLGIFASAIAAILIDYSTRPFLALGLDDSPPVQGQSPGSPAHAFYHLKVKNMPAKWPLSGRRPAWSCQATIEVLSEDGRHSLFGPIPARWVSQPEPIVSFISAGNVIHFPDVAKMIAGRKIDIHSHEDQKIVIAVKFEGETDCFLFTNESYAFPRWSNPQWKLGQGRYRLRVTIYYERGRAYSDFLIENVGSTRGDLKIISI
ncbi:MAG: hypothetical protein QXL01_02265 [Thermoplasmatales archaeon]|jgi:hypothetical protein